MIVIVGFLVFIGILVYVGTGEHREHTKRMKSGEDKKKIQEIVKKIVPESDNCTIAYATYTKQESNGIRHVYLQFALDDGTEYSLCNGIEDAMIHNYMQLCFQHNGKIMFGYTKENQERYKALVKENKGKNHGK